MKLLFVRHGQTQANVERRYLGALDVPINEAGFRQAHDVASRVVSGIAARYCLPLLRARQTADVMAGTLGLPVHILAAFRERGVGVFEGLTPDEARTGFPDLWAQNITRQWHAAPNGGETIAAVFDRVAQGLRDLLRRHPQDTVLLVAHGFIAKVLRALANSSAHDFFAWQLGNGAVLELHLRPDGTFDHVDPPAL